MGDATFTKHMFFTQQKIVEDKLYSLTKSFLLLFCIMFTFFPSHPSVKHRHSLTLLSVSSDKVKSLGKSNKSIFLWPAGCFIHIFVQLGDYQCKAENDVGEALKTITVAGLYNVDILIFGSMTK